MNLAERLESFKKRGFSEDRAVVIVLMREAAIILFNAFPDSLVLIGGANLILFHESTRHSADLDLLATTVPKAQDMVTALNDGLGELGELLGVGIPKAQIHSSDESLVKLAVAVPSTPILFTVDLTIGATLDKEVEKHEFESASSQAKATVRSASSDLQLLQKAEALLGRRIIKVRDAYDAKLLMDRRATLSGELKNHLGDYLLWEEMTATQIKERISQIDEKRCRAEPANFIPEKTFNDLQEKSFQPLRDAVGQLFADWISED